MKGCDLYIEDAERREVEKALAREIQKVDELRAQNLDSSHKLCEAHAQRSALEARLVQIEQNLEEVGFLMSSPKRNIQYRSPSSFHLEASDFALFPYEELDRATRGFESSSKIGEGRYATVYKGILRHTVVAIKRLHSHGTEAQNEFHREVDVLSSVRHPKFVTLMGVCPEAWCIVYEYLPDGSLEDRLACKNNSASLSWHCRLRIAADVCSAVIFLHSSKPRAIVHGDLKPANVLLNSRIGAKLVNFGLSRPLSHPCSSSASSFTVGSDIYSLGVIILRLITSLPAQHIVRDVEEALKKKRLHLLLDQSAGNWPFVQAIKLLYLALQCCTMAHSIRPSLLNGVWRILAPIQHSPFCCPPLLLSDGDALPPSQFFCPISLEVMKDPQLAADGYSYEGDALRGWFEAGNHTSPMTNQVLPHRQLIPNHALRSYIQDWLHQHPAEAMILVTGRARSLRARSASRLAGCPTSSAPQTGAG